MGKILQLSLEKIPQNHGVEKKTKNAKNLPYTKSRQQNRQNQRRQSRAFCWVRGKAF